MSALGNSMTQTQPAGGGFNPIRSITRAFWTGVDVATLFVKSLVNPAALQERGHPVLRADTPPPRPSPFGGAGQRLGGGPPSANMRGIGRSPQSATPGSS